MNPFSQAIGISPNRTRLAFCQVICNLQGPGPWAEFLQISACGASFVPASTVQYIYAPHVLAGVTKHEMPGIPLELRRIGGIGYEILPEFEETTVTRGARARPRRRQTSIIESVMWHEHLPDAADASIRATAICSVLKPVLPGLPPQPEWKCSCFLIEGASAAHQSTIMLTVRR